MPKAKWGDFTVPNIEKVLRERLHQPIEVYVSGAPKPFWGFVVDLDQETLKLEGGGEDGSRKQIYVRMADISYVVIK